MKALKSIKPIYIVAGLFVCGVLAFPTLHDYAKASGFLTPGAISATHPKDQPLNGFASHAEFENDCTHCHAPIHCVTDTRCQDCHLEIALQRSEVRGLHGKLPGTDRCQNCHVEHQGADVVISEFAYTGVDHYALTGFSLALHTVDFENETMDCSSCHSKDRFVKDTLDCITCHSQADHDGTAEQMELYGTDCVSCHDGLDRMQEFDHNDYYVLDGQHAEVECVACHQEYVFAGTAQDCAACHADPEMHAGQFGLKCERCHTATAWTPAELTQHTFFLDHGGDLINDCETCHTHTMWQIDCFGCHDHTVEEMEAVHVKCGLSEEYATQTCAECHPTGTRSELETLACVSSVSNANR